MDILDILSVCFEYCRKAELASYRYYLLDFCQDPVRILVRAMCSRGAAIGYLSGDI